jgi:hypothetical protein
MHNFAAKAPGPCLPRWWLRESDREALNSWVMASMPTLSVAFFFEGETRCRPKHCYAVPAGRLS